MNLIYFSKEAYKLLKKDLSANTEKYLSDEPWLEEYFASEGIDEYYKTSSIVVNSVSLLYSGEDDKAKNSDDITNSRMLYDAYKDSITPLQASDPLLWSALSHIVFKDYIMKRWKKGDGTIGIGERFFATDARSSLLYYNAISRLWWSGYLTYDEGNKADPYHLTKVLFSAQQIQKDLFDQPFSMNKTIVKGLLNALKRIQDETGNASTTPFRMCCHSYLNRYGAVSILDSLDSSEIEDISYKYMSTLINGKSAVE